MADKRTSDTYVPSESVELEGKIVTAAKSTMADENYERGYPEPESYLHMENLGGGRKR